MDINFLLANEQVSLLRARFARAADDKHRHLLIAADHARNLRRTTYPHRSLASGLLA